MYPSLLGIYLKVIFFVSLSEVHSDASDNNLIRSSLYSSDSYDFIRQRRALSLLFLPVEEVMNDASVLLNEFDIEKNRQRTQHCVHKEAL